MLPYQRFFSFSKNCCTTWIQAMIIKMREKNFFFYAIQRLNIKFFLLKRKKKQKKIMCNTTEIVLFICVETFSNFIHFLKFYIHNQYIFYEVLKITHQRCENFLYLTSLFVSLEPATNEWNILTKCRVLFELKKNSAVYLSDRNSHSKC